MANTTEVRARCPEWMAVAVEKAAKAEMLKASDIVRKSIAAYLKENGEVEKFEEAGV